MLYKKLKLVSFFRFWYKFKKTNLKIYLNLTYNKTKKNIENLPKKCYTTVNIKIVKLKEDYFNSILKQLYLGLWCLQQYHSLSLLVFVLLLAYCQQGKIQLLIYLNSVQNINTHLTSLDYKIKRVNDTDERFFRNNL